MIHRLFSVLAATLLLCLRPCSADAEQPKRMYRIGALNEAWAPDHPAVEGLKAGLKELGLAEGRDVSFDIRFTEGDQRAMPGAAAALVKARVDLIFTSGEPAAQAARAATQTIPIVFTLVGDPVATGVVKEIAHPGGNITGVSGLTTELVPKRLETLKALAPTIRRVRIIYYPDDPSSLAIVRKAQEAGPLLKLEIAAVPVRTPEELSRALKAVRAGEGLLPPPTAVLDIPAQMLETSLAARVPTVFESTFWVGFGALASYGSDFYAQGFQAARLVAKILRGARPQDLPVEGANRIELAVNLKTARRLGLTIPREILLRADKVIQ